MFGEVKGTLYLFPICALSFSECFHFLSKPFSNVFSV